MSKRSIRKRRHRRLFDPVAACDLLQKAADILKKRLPAEKLARIFYEGSQI